MLFYLHISKKSSNFAAEKFNTMYRTPEAYIADVEYLTGKSNRTAQRIMQKIKKAFGIKGRKRPTIEQVKTYLTKENIAD